MVFCYQDRPYRQDRPYYQGRPITINMESYRILQNLVESLCQNRPVIFKVGFLSESTSLTIRQNFFK